VRHARRTQHSQPEGHQYYRQSESLHDMFLLFA
jgi:hypothetical protein